MALIQVSIWSLYSTLPARNFLINPIRIVWVNKKLVGTSSYVPIHSGGPVWLDANFKIHTTQTAAGNRANELSS